MGDRFRAIRRVRLIAGALALVATAALSGCTASSTGDTVITTDLARIVVTGPDGAKPLVTVPAPFEATKLDRRILVKGTGTIVQPGFRVTANYVGVNGTDGSLFANTWGLTSSAFTLDTSQTIRGMVKGLSGVPVGSRVLIVVPPGDGYGAAGNTNYGIGPADSMIFVIDVEAAQRVMSRATGTPVTPKAGLPTVKLDPGTGEPSITIPRSSPPTKMVVQTLIQGHGAKVAKGQTITAQYTGVVWNGGRQFDSTWDRTPASFLMGEGKVLAGWDEGVIGQRVGSQVMLVLPPSKAFGSAGKPEKGIKGTDTVVFVIDILDSASSTAP